MENYSQQISNLFINSFHDSSDSSDNSIYSLSVYRQNAIKVATYFKLNSQLNCDMAVDAFSIDNLENEFRFTTIYLLQSTNQNFSVRLILKTNNSFALLSLQGVFPAFN
jgi:NADH:ubiquinone oxidoreductase subunit C